MNIYDHAAQSILRSDRNKSDEFGGQQFTHIERCEADEELVTLYANKDSTAKMRIPFELIYRPDHRKIAPADVYDAVLFAFKAAAAELRSDVP